ncbi:ethanolamine ammonia-lyase subunit EutC [Carboxydothermus ferrireducens]|uniref:Ethanolamine ammonia-lyase small subunit n=2 Tax=Carboxydothermus TaxID=129957 RepID=A0ABX2RBD3_9THEO|nr:ethanolamine ammonia-lyase subunit EutC [Carboxydothermus ferrireducens]NYE58488.1 ethanolamine ammonia-lyase small subunit [Carboxydothermus ferrireducens DSM 11255]
MVENNVEKMIIEAVVKELAKKGVQLNFNSGEEKENKKDEAIFSKESNATCSIIDVEDYLEVPEINDVWVPNPKNLAALKRMKECTPARIGLYRAGARPKTNAYLRFFADHAKAMDAVFLDVSEDFVKKMGLIEVQTLAKDKEEFLKRPDLGKKLNEESVKKLLENCPKNIQVQILVVDGLSSSAIEANVPEVLPVLIKGLEKENIILGKPVFVKYGRVGVQDHVGMLLNAEVVVSLIGERPGLATADSMSAYIIYKPNEKTVEADRTVISNIHKGGTPPAEAAAHLVEVIKQVLKAKASGMNLSKQL